MKTMIALAGKGGTGKTTIAALIIRALLNQDAPLLAIDADPNNNLWQLLGLEASRTIMDIVDNLMQRKDSIPQGMTKERYIDLKIQEALEEAEKFDLLSMGRPEGPGCYCYANNLLRDLIERLEKNYDIVVIDNEAGMEHLSRRLTRKIDCLIIVSDFSVIGIRSAKNISDLVKGLDIDVLEKVLVVNKATTQIDVLKGEIDKTGLNLIGVIPYDKSLEEICIKGGSVFQINDNSTAFTAVKNILSKTQKVKRESIWT